MKKIVIATISILLAINTFAQTPNAFKYQTVVRNASGMVLNNQNVDFKISILETSASGSSVYVETFSTTTNQFGLVNLEIGTGAVVSGTFSTINWAVDLHFVKIEANIGSGMQNMGTSQLLSVPYALNAKTAETVSLNGDVTGNAGTNTVEKIQGLEVSTNTPANGQVLKWDSAQSKWIPNDDALGAAGSTDGVVSSVGITGSATKTITLDRTNGLGQITASFVDSVNDADSDTTNEIQDLQLMGNTLTITNNIGATNIDLSGYANIWQENSNDIYYNGGNVGVGVNNPDGKLIVQADAGMHADTAIFEVKNKNGKTIFAVYEEGVRVYVDDSGTKANSSKAGFAVGGFNATKALTNEYFRVTPDSIRAYIESNSGSSKAGFAVGGFNATKITPDILFNIGASDSTDVIDSVARIAWYPQKEAFLAGRVIVQSTDSVGKNSFATGHVSKAMGDYSQAFGFRARAVGDNSTAIGNYAEARGQDSYAFGNNSYVGGVNSYSIGNGAKVDGLGSYAIGSGAKADGNYSFAIGSNGVDSAGVATAPTLASGTYSYAFGMGSLASGIGAFSIGTLDSATNSYSLAMGYRSTASGFYSVAIGSYINSSGQSSVALGYRNTASGHSSTAFGSLNIASGGASTAFGNVTEASGDISLSCGVGTKASGYKSSAFGSGTEAIGEGSFSIGSQTKAEGDYSIATGINTIASGDYSFAMGSSTQALNLFSVVSGDRSTASGILSFSHGYELIAKSYDEFVIGKYNDTTTSTFSGYWSWVDPIFVVGDGDDNTHRHNAFIIKKDGNVGIGTNNPEAPLDIETNSSGYALHIEENGSGTEEWQIGVDLAGDLNFFDGSTSQITFEDGGNVGINTNNPSNTLDVYGDVSFGGGTSSLNYDGNSENILIRAQSDNWYIGVQNETSASTSDFFIGQSSTENGTFHIENDGSIGMGTTAPGNHKLSVRSSDSGTGGSTGYFNNVLSTGISLFVENTSTASSDVAFLVTTRGSGNIVKFYSYHGNGTGDTEFRFDNDGDGYCDNAWHGGGADYAEYFPKSDTSVIYEPGDIIMMSPNKTYTVDGANDKNTNLLVGVYSDNPAMVGNSPAEDISHNNDVLVGLMGVIKTKVNTENGAIKIGDYITISSTPKVGMKATGNGMVVGRAMDNYDGKGTGKVNVLVEVDWYYNTKEGNITSSEIKNTLSKQQTEIEILKSKVSDIEVLKAEINELKNILELKAEK